ncbi:hypothetical protein ACIA5D_36740 [Actinoplanes sp. NPDC051513]|uniref:hypothetical protein n=1 Tax=Actinoplanes sp. NPDC051513 TaxID=3363908 RepID=UPI00379F9B0D
MSNRNLSPLELVIAEAIARSRSYISLAAVDAVDDGEPDDIRREAHAVAAALEADAESGAQLRAALLSFCAGAEEYQRRSDAWVPTPALRYLLTGEHDTEGGK